MKKLISIFISVLIAAIGLSVTSIATSVSTLVPNPGPENVKQPVVTFSDDFKTVYYDDYEYVQKDLSMFISNVDSDYEIGYYEDYDGVVSTDDIMLPQWAEYELSETQKETVHSVEIYGDDIILNVSINYRDGTYYSYDVLRTDYLDDYDKLLTTKGDVYTLHFDYPENNEVDIDCDILFENEPKHITPSAFTSYDEYYEIYVSSDDGKLSFNPGMIIICGDEYYYLDYEESGASLYLDFLEFYYSEEGFDAYPITDEATVAAIKEGQQLYYEDDYGYLQNDELADSISYFFLIMLFGVVPGCVCVVSFVYAIIKKKTYRKLLFGASAFCLAEIVAFIIFLIVANIK
ncbi:MAG: hypothetical protein E7530_04925 [Ruminococcaceae bacterium]|nr:hypothetical protein [Oscillospiraceae bacterium]